MSTLEYWQHVTRTAQTVRERNSLTGDAVSSGAFDRFVSALARAMAKELHAEYGHRDGYTISDLEHWHGDKRNAITLENFKATCSAHGIPQEIVSDFYVMGRDRFNGAFSTALFESFGWVTTP